MSLSDRIVSLKSRIGTKQGRVHTRRKRCTNQILSKGTLGC